MVAHLIVKDCIHIVTVIIWEIKNILNFCTKKNKREYDIWLCHIVSWTELNCNTDDKIDNFGKLGKLGKLDKLDQLGKLCLLRQTSQTGQMRQY